MPSTFTGQLPWVVFVFALFALFGGLVRQGRLQGRAILWVGALISVVAVIASALPVWTLFQSGAVSLPVFLLNPLIMAGVSAWAVNVAYRSQLVTDVATVTLGDTKIIVRVCQPSRVPDADALILPVDTNLQASESFAVPFLRALSLPTMRALRKAAPVKMGQVLSTDGGDLAPAKIIFVSVADYPQPVTAERLRRGVEMATQQARKNRAESLAVPVGAMRGLSAAEATTQIVGGVLKQHKAFAEIVLIAASGKLAQAATDVVREQTANLTMVK